MEEIGVLRYIGKLYADDKIPNAYVYECSKCRQKITNEHFISEEFICPYCTAERKKIKEHHEDEFSAGIL